MSGGPSDVLFLSFSYSRLALPYSPFGLADTLDRWMGLPLIAATMASSCILHIMECMYTVGSGVA